MTHPTDHTTYDGHTVDWLTRTALDEVASRLGYPLTITQGSFNTTVSASAGTHNGGGVVDLRAWDAKNKVAVLRAIGFAAWHRLPSQGPWPEHVHAVLIGNPLLSPAAKSQIDSYLAGRNGLANHGADDGPREHLDARWTWVEPGTEPAPTPVGLFDNRLADAPTANLTIGTFTLHDTDTLLRSLPGVDVAMCQGVEFDVRDELPTTVGVSQDLSTPGSSRVAVVWDASSAQHATTESHKLVGPSTDPEVKMRAKWLAEATLDVNLTNDALTIDFASAQRPPAESGDLVEAFDREIAAFVRSRSHPVVLGIDAVDDGAAWAEQMGLLWMGVGADGFAFTPSLPLQNVRRLDDELSANAPVVADLRLG